jgi:site-specific recombinase XerD
MRSSEELGSVVSEFLGAAEAGSARAPGGDRYTPDELRTLRRSLAHASTELGSLPVGELRTRDVRKLIDELGEAGLPPSRAEEIVDALRAVYAYAMQHDIVTTSPLVGLAPAAAREGPSPTTAMIELGQDLARWGVRLMVMLFVLAAVGLAVAVA